MLKRMGSSANFGKYKIVSVISAGPLSEVYKAQDLVSGRIVVLKVLGQFAESELEMSFEQRAKLAISLRHPHLVTIYEAGRTEGKYYIAMQFLESKPLDRVIREKGPLYPGNVLNIVSQLTDALEYLHWQRLIHLDVKPNNILLDSTGNIILIDLPLVRVLEWTYAVATEQPWGMPEYMSPEQALKTEADWRADIYSLGILAYELLTGHVPFKCNSPQETAYAQVYTAPMEPTSLNPLLPPSVNLVFMKVLAKDRTIRYQSAGEFCRDLQKALFSGYNIMKVIAIPS
jgi:eukaryotic-like serine/threonine-protein kinase